MKYFAFAALGIIIFGGVLLFGRSVEPVTTSEISSGEKLGQEQASPVVIIHGVELEIEVVRTAEEKAQGLSGRESLAENAGMLFVFEEPVLPAFWMEDMKFPIDIIWIASDDSIVDITENISAETFPQTFQPREPVQYVLEVNASWAKSHNVSIGSKAEIGISSQL